MFSVHPFFSLFVLVVTPNPINDSFILLAPYQEKNGLNFLKDPDDTLDTKQSRISHSSIFNDLLTLSHCKG